MSAEPQLFRVNYKSKESEEISEINFADYKLRERDDIQEWIVTNPSILGEELLLIAKEFSDFDKTKERPDLLAVDTDGRLVIIELKRDDSGADVHWQAIKYASYLQHAKQDDIIRILADYEDVSTEESEEILLGHLESHDLNTLNYDQRIILASHRFAPEVTSAVLWLNERVPSEDLITCIQLTPYPDDSNKERIYLQANTIIPVPGTETYRIQVGRVQDEGLNVVRNTTSRTDQSDIVTQFVKRIQSRTLEMLPRELSPERDNDIPAKWGKELRYRIWHSSPNTWGMSGFCYALRVSQRTSSVDVKVNFEPEKKSLRSKLSYSEENLRQLKNLLKEIYAGGVIQDDKTFIGVRVTHTSDVLDNSLAEKAASTLSEMIKAITPAVNKFEDERASQESTS